MSARHFRCRTCRRKYGNLRDSRCMDCHFIASGITTTVDGYFVVAEWRKPVQP